MFKGKSNFFFSNSKIIHARPFEFDLYGKRKVEGELGDNASMGKVEDQQSGKQKKYPNTPPTALPVGQTPELKTSALNC